MSIEGPLETVVIMMPPEGRARIAEAVKRRWAVLKAAKDFKVNELGRT